MPDRSRKRRPADLNSLAASIVADSTDEDKDDEPADDGKDPAAVSLGRKGGLKGGKARAAKLTPEQRSDKTLTKAAGGYPTTPAMAAGVADHVWSLKEIAGLLD